MTIKLYIRDHRIERDKCLVDDKQNFEHETNKNFAKVMDAADKVFVDKDSMEHVFTTLQNELHKLFIQKCTEHGIRYGK